MIIQQTIFRSVSALLVALATGGAAHAAADVAAADVRSNWVTTWGAPVQAASATTAPLPLDTTVRQTVWVSVGGDAVRVKFTNAMSAAPVTLGGASIGLKAAGSSVTASTLRRLTFGGKSSVDVPAQGTVLSDAVDLAVPSLTDVSISIFLPAGSGTITQYPGSRKVTYVLTGADATMAADLTASATTATVGYFVSSVEVRAAKARGTVAAVGDSIVAGGGSTVENAKWSDRLAARLAALPAPLQMGVLGLGIGGNRLLSGATTNPAALARFDRDVLGMAGITHVIMADGINDLGSVALTDPSLPPNPDDIEYGMRQIIERAHARGVKVIATTMGPAWGFRGYENIEIEAPGVQRLGAQRRSQAGRRAGRLRRGAPRSRQSLAHEGGVPDGRHPPEQRRAPGDGGRGQPAPPQVSAKRSARPGAFLAGRAAQRLLRNSQGRTFSSAEPAAGGEAHAGGIRHVARSRARRRTRFRRKGRP